MQVQTLPEIHQLICYLRIENEGVYVILRVIELTTNELRYEIDFQETSDEYMVRRIVKLTEKYPSPEHMYRLITE